jgi:outer membrane protein OmpA-like peptidoglycan-associated protein
MLKYTLSFVIFLLIQNIQAQPGNVWIGGQWDEKIHNPDDTLYMFFDDQYRKRYDIKLPIINGRFSGWIPATLPAYARFHYGQASFIQDVYIDSDSTILHFSNQKQPKGTDSDSLNELKLLKVSGSSLHASRIKLEAELKRLAALDSLGTDSVYQFLERFISINRNSRLAPYLLSKAGKLDEGQLGSLTTLLDSSLYTMFEWRELSRLLKSARNQKNRLSGAVLPQFSLQDAKGTIFTNQDFKGKLIYLDFWASWCGPCRQKHPYLRQLYKELVSPDFEIVSVSLEKTIDKWSKAVENDRLVWPQLIDTNAFKGVLPQVLSLEAIPTAVLLDAKGKIIDFNVDEEVIRGLLNKPENRNWASQLDYQVLFETNAYSLSSKQNEELEARFATVTNAHAGDTLYCILSGMADSTGTDAYNYKLASERIATIRKSLADRFAAFYLIFKEINWGEYGFSGSFDSSRAVRIQLYNKTRVGINNDRIDTVVVLNQLYFKPDSPVLTGGSLSVLSSYIDRLRVYRNRRIHVRGHVNYNAKPLKRTDVLYKLSENRAEVIYNALLQSGFDVNKLSFEGVGNSEMIYPKARSDEERFQNMRVDVVVYSE